MHIVVFVFEKKIGEMMVSFSLLFCIFVDFSALSVMCL